MVNRARAASRARRWRYGVVGLAVAGAMAACGGGNTGGTGSAAGYRLAPNETLLASGQSANVAAVAADLVSRQDEEGVVVSGWSVAEPSLASVVAQGDSAVVTGLAPGLTRLTAVSNQGTFTATVRVGAQAVGGAPLDDLATFLIAAALGPPPPT